MTDPPVRVKPAAAAKVLITGASITSVLVMTAAMGSADEVEPSDSVPVADGSVFGGWVVDSTPASTPIGSVVSGVPAPTVPVVGQVGSSPAPTPAAPVAAPTPIIVNVPAPAPAPSASTSKSN